MSNRLDALQQKIIELQEELASLRRSEYIARAGTARALDTQFPNALLHLPFDGGAPYERDFSVNLYGHKLQRPTVASGGIIGRPGKLGKAVQLAPTTTNLCPNPVMRTLWDANSGPTTLELSTDWKRFDQYSMRVVGGASWSGGRTLFAATAGATYALSCYVKIVSGTAGLRIQQLASPYTSYMLKNVSGPFEGWVTVTGVVPNTETCMIVLGANGEAYFDGVQLEAKAYPTPFCYGDMPGHAWTGTTHNSTSTRANANLRYASPLPAAGSHGTISLWVSRAWGTESTAHRFIDFNYTNAPIAYVSSNFQLNLGGAGVIGGDPTDYTPWEWVHLVGTWDDTTTNLYLNGELVGAGGVGSGIPATTELQVGNRNSADRSLNGYLDDLLILDHALTPTEVRRLYEAELPVLCPPQSWQPLMGAGAPTWGYPGMTYIDTTNNRWYVNVDGTWRYAGLT